MSFKYDTLKHRALEDAAPYIPQYDNPDFDAAFELFQTRHIQEYLSNRENPDYDISFPRETSDFLVFFPQYNTQENVSLMHHVVFRQFFYTEREDEHSQVFYMSRSLEFEYTEDGHITKDEFMYYFEQLEQPVTYDKMVENLGEIMTDAEDSPTFNSFSVFYLQPEHYHYFQPFFPKNPLMLQSIGRYQLRSTQPPNLSL